VVRVQARGRLGVQPVGHRDQGAVGPHHTGGRFESAANPGGKPDPRVPGGEIATGHRLPPHPRRVERRRLPLDLIGRERGEGAAPVVELGTEPALDRCPRVGRRGRRGGEPGVCPVQGAHGAQHVVRGGPRRRVRPPVDDAHLRPGAYALHRREQADHAAADHHDAHRVTDPRWAAAAG
jgi:hypothetical protein